MNDPHTNVDDPYAVLGVAPTASSVQIRMAYRDATRRLHPDRRGGVPPDHDRFTALVDAWSILRDPQRRAAFDAMRRETRMSTSAVHEVHLDRTSTRRLRQAFVATIVVIALATFLVFIIGLSQSGTTR